MQIQLWKQQNKGHHLYLFHMLCITKHAHLHLRAGDMGQLDGAAEILVLLRVVVLDTNLKLNGLSEIPVLDILSLLRTSICNLLQQNNK
jgi:hypothetical protein